MSRGGYMGKFLWVNLATGKLEVEQPDDDLCRDFIGGYGVGSRLLYSRMKAGADPLGPDNILGLITGPLTGTPAISGTRYTAVGKSPLTGGWGDANSGGHFGPRLKFSGFDAVFFTGISERPVYLLLDNGKAELKDAGSIWGKDTYYTEDTLKAEYGNNSEVASIGPAGEKLCRVACIITRHGDAAARSGLGAIMGSKKVKAVVARGDQPVPLADSEAADRIRKEHMEAFQARFGGMHVYGTSGHGDTSAMSGDTPVKNWGGIGAEELKDVSGLHRDKMIANLANRTGCWQCPSACKAVLKAGVEFPYPAGSKRVEYETIGAFGANCLNTNAESIAMANYICNAYGMDTISAGSIIAFAMELYENGIITRKDTGGIDLKWGDPDALVAMTEKVARREAIGDILAEGVQIAAEKIGKGARKYAVHAGGQEPGMHDPKLKGHPLQFPRHPTATVYKMDSTPGRHTGAFGPDGFERHLNNSMGTCLFVFLSPLPSNPTVSSPFAAPMMKAVTGWDRSWEELLKAGERIANMRHVFNLREGINPVKVFIHNRVLGIPPQQEGPLAGVTIDERSESLWNLGALDWDWVTTRPSRKKLLELGLVDVADEIAPPLRLPGFGPAGA
jgi:aldehyde:ferredoxin oxidoreductase